MLMAIMTVAGLPYTVFALSDVQNWDSYSNGDNITTVSSWLYSGSGSATVSTDFALSGTKSVKNTTTSNGHFYRTSGGATSAGRFDFAVRVVASTQNYGGGAADGASEMAYFNFAFNDLAFTASAYSGCSWSNTNISSYDGTFIPLRVDWTDNGSTIDIEPFVDGVSLGSQTCTQGASADLTGATIYTNHSSFGMIYYDDIALYTDADVPVVDPPDYTTHIETVVPEDGDTVATSSPTTIGATGYINPSDFKEGARIRIKLDRQTDAQAVGALIAWEAAFGNWTTLPLTADEDFDVSTTSIESLLGENREGEWHMRTELQIPKYTLFGFTLTYETYDFVNSSFVYGALTGIDIIQNYGEDVLEAVVGAADPFANCQFDFSSVLDFSAPDNIITCSLGVVSSLIVPSSGQLQAIMDNQKNEFLTKPPFGYIYLAGSSLLGYSDVATSTLSSSNLTITFPSTGAFASSSAGSVAGETITFIDWDEIAAGLAESEVSTAMEPFYDFINLFMTAGFLFWLWRFGTRFMTP